MDGKVQPPPPAKVLEGEHGCEAVRILDSHSSKLPGNYETTEIEQANKLHGNHMRT
jgi:hypothetical protein